MNKRSIVLFTLLITSFLTFVSAQSLIRVDLPNSTCNWEILTSTGIETGSIVPQRGHFIDRQGTLEFRMYLDISTFSSVNGSSISNKLKSVDQFIGEKTNFIILKSLDIVSGSITPGFTHESTMEITINGFSQVIQVPLILNIQDGSIGGNISFQIDRTQFGMTSSLLPEIDNTGNFVSFNLAIAPYQN